MRQVISVLVRNHPGVLSHVAGLFARRAYNIEKHCGRNHRSGRYHPDYPGGDRG